MLNSLLRSPKCRQIGQIELNLSIDGVATTPVASGPDVAIVQSITDGGVGIYTIVFKEPAKMNLHVAAITSLTTRALFHVAAVSKNSVTIHATNDANSAIDAQFNVQIIFFDQLSYYF
jgi:hypothetical protein